jgi:hypothetical protein
MSTFYFVGGPKADQLDEFFERLGRVGGTPNSWQIFPHAAEDGRALHIVRAESAQSILDHLRHFDDIYDRTEIVEVRDPTE